MFLQQNIQVNTSINILNVVDKVTIKLKINEGETQLYR